ncbi:MAG: hypothetical protein CMM87_00680 [Rickettsiales bacterium]|mgnify:CR=1 FL=1|nr:hypothetical protein [Rickettsiales bacterium]|tara:strand:+ start:53042 stop:53761 length:720 start_codon:yes stop_codon:yes gene_type:complete
MTVLLTRPKGDNGIVSQSLKEYGIDSCCCPLLKIIPVTFCDKNIIECNSQYDFCIITSKNALANMPRLKNLKAFYVVGESLSQAISQRFPGIDVVEAQTASDLLDIIRSDKDRGKYLFVSGDKVTIDFSKELKKINLECSRLVTYQTKPNENNCITKAFNTRRIKGVVLFSTFSAQCYINEVERHGLLEKSKTLYHFLLGENISRSIEKIPSHLQMVASYPTSKSLCSKIVEVLQRDKG